MYYLFLTLYRYLLQCYSFRYLYYLSVLHYDHQADISLVFLFFFFPFLLFSIFSFLLFPVSFFPFPVFFSLFPIENSPDYCFLLCYLYRRCYCFHCFLLHIPIEQTNLTIIIFLKFFSTFFCLSAFISF